MLSPGGQIHVGFRLCLMNKIAVSITSAYQHRTVIRRVDLPDMRRNIAHGNANPAIVRTIWFRRMNRLDVMQGNLSRLQLTEYRFTLRHRDGTFLSTGQQVFL